MMRQPLPLGSGRCVAPAFSEGTLLDEFIERWSGYTLADFRRDWRAENTTSHLTSAEAVKGAMERLRLRREL